MFLHTPVPAAAAAAATMVPVPPAPPAPPIGMLSKEDAANAEGCMKDEFLDALVVKIADVDFSALEPDTVEHLGNMQGIYWLIGMFGGRPCFKQEVPPTGPLLMWWLQDKQEGGWYITDKIFTGKHKDKDDVTMVGDISHKLLNDV